MWELEEFEEKKKRRKIKGKMGIKKATGWVGLCIWEYPYVIYRK